MKLDASQKHLLKLVRQGADADGWAPVSAPVLPLVAKLPGELVIVVIVGDEGSGKAKLTEAGNNVLDWT